MEVIRIGTVGLETPPPAQWLEIGKTNPPTFFSNNPRSSILPVSTPDPRKISYSGEKRE